MALYGPEGDEEAAERAVQGVSCPTGAVVARKPFEALSELLRRSRPLLGDPVATWFTYTDEFMNREEDLPVPDVGIEPEPQPEPLDPFALAGIGRVATASELEQWAITPIPAERII